MNETRYVKEYNGLHNAKYEDYYGTTNRKYISPTILKINETEDGYDYSEIIDSKIILGAYSRGAIMKCIGDTLEEAMLVLDEDYTIIYKSTNGEKLRDEHNNGLFYVGDAHVLANTLSKDGDGCVCLDEKPTYLAMNNFRGNPGLTEITIPNSLTTFGFLSFGNNENLVTINFKGTMDEWNNIDIDRNAFKGCNLEGKIYCTDGVLDLIDYMPGGGGSGSSSGSFY